MTLGLMQPYFAPYLGYFDLISKTDEWVVFDTAQFIRRGWVNRNRVLKVNGGWSYITVPVRYSPLETPITDICIDDSQPWRERILAQFDVIRKKAPFYDKARTVLQEAISTPTSSLSQMNVVLMEKACGYLGLRFRPRLLSSIKLPFAKIERPGDWALHICRALGADKYLNPPGGEALYDPVLFDSFGISLHIQRYTSLKYSTSGFPPEENMSILDVLAWNHPAVVLDHLNRQAKY